MEKDKLNKKDIHFFVLPLLIIGVLIGILTYRTVYKRIEEVYDVVKSSTLNIADSYLRILINSKKASNTISDLLEEQIIAASQAVLLLSEDEHDISLIEIADKFRVDQINLYDSKGRIILSNIEGYEGWRALEGHPVYGFMTSGNRTFVEDIRKDTVNQKFYKYGYLKRDDNTFVQIGILAENFLQFTEEFEINQLISEIASKENIQNAYFIDNNFKIINSNIEKSIGSTITDKETMVRLSRNEADVERNIIDGEDVLHVFAPVFYEGEKLGTLSIVWVSNMMDKEIKSIVSNGIVQFIIIILIIGGVLYYAYTKNKSNVEIAYYDKLTGLPNNEYLQEYLEQEIKNLGKKRKAVLLLNCTNFKTLNTTYGFKYGDYILSQISSVVKGLLEPEDMLFRFNADRFILVIEEYVDTLELKNIAKNIIDIFNKPFDNIAKYEHINMEISILEIQNKNTTVDEVLKNASLALDYIKYNSKDNIVFYDNEMKVRVDREDKIEKVLRAVIRGIDKESFYIEFQPKLNIKTNKVIGFEALSRMYIEELGYISPIEFIELAEKKKLIYNLGIYILEKSCDFLSELKDKGYEDINIAVNISGIQLLRDEFVDDIGKYIKKLDVDLSSLEFEITESILLENFNLINERLKIIKDFGIIISLDDFGTGFSSFSRLQDLNIDIEKIDKYFIDKISTDEEGVVITADIISMAHKIGLAVIAEGVEDEIQMEYLERHNCDIIQGYIISKPLKRDKAIEFLKSRHGGINGENFKS